jgi:hypothetical protein
MRERKKRGAQTATLPSSALVALVLDQRTEVSNADSLSRAHQGALWIGERSAERGQRLNDPMKALRASLRSQTSPRPAPVKAAFNV